MSDHVPRCFTSSASKFQIENDYLVCRQREGKNPYTRKIVQVDGLEPTDQQQKLRSSLEQFNLLVLLLLLLVFFLSFQRALVTFSFVIISNSQHWFWSGVCAGMSVAFDEHIFCAHVQFSSSFRFCLFSLLFRPPARYTSYNVKSNKKII